MVPYLLLAKHSCRSGPTRCKGFSMSERSASTRFDPHTFSFPDSGGPSSADRKAPPATALYPNLNDYCRVGIDQYVSREHMRLEWDRLWTRTWTLAGRET